jgi:hypothetical protein
MALNGSPVVRVGSRTPNLTTPMTSSQASWVADVNVGTTKKGPQPTMTVDRRPIFFVSFLRDR